MDNRVYIDNYDITERFGITVLADSIARLIAFPSMKAPEAIDWYEYDGVEADLSNPKMSAKEVTLSFFAPDDSMIGDFFDLLTTKPYHVWEFACLGMRYALRLDAPSDISTFRRSQYFSLQFIDDEVDRDYSNEDTPDFGKAGTGYEIDGVDLSKYGVTVLAGTRDSLLEAPAIKKNISRDFSFFSGNYYEATEGRFEQKEVDVKCLMQAGDISAFWAAYNSLLKALFAPDERTFTVNSKTEYGEFACYYKSCDTDEFILSGGSVSWAFSLTLVFTNYRPTADDVVLATTDGRIIATTQGEAIDLKKIMLA